MGWHQTLSARCGAQSFKSNGSIIVKRPSVFLAVVSDTPFSCLSDMWTWQPVVSFITQTKLRRSMSQTLFTSSSNFCQSSYTGDVSSTDSQLYSLLRASIPGMYTDGSRFTCQN